MPNHKLGRNILLTGGFVLLLYVVITWKNKDMIGRILFLIQSFLFFVSAYIQHKELIKSTKGDLKE